ncbi:Methicillin resistance mecR1 protein [Lacipirellula limnantheis]|uniref:Methicillin resistance mecR1 protein n=2 Tax=Lacipirellula limnantheis TaxID=2528024 RepID=A0A517TY41_9BACT|nr:Methicillin resistance mecR1 protein [Lacipirellula limnantheis]
MINSVSIIDWAIVQLAQLTLLIALVALLDRLLWRRLPSVTFLIWVLVLLKALTPPLWSSPVGIFSWTFGGLVGPGSPDDFPQMAWAQQSTRLIGLSFSEELARWLIGAWSLGALATILRWCASWQELIAAIANSDRRAAEDICPMVERISGKLGLRKPPSVVVVKSSLGPAVFGYRSPKLILPAELLLSLSSAELESVVGHELLHIRRHDFGVALLGMMVKALFWFFPPARWAVEKTIAAAEHCVDRDVVTQLRMHRVNYASALLRVLEVRNSFRPLAGVPSMRAADVTEHRITCILHDLSAGSSRNGRFTWSVLLLSAAIVLPGRPLNIFGPRCIPACPRTDAHQSVAAAEISAEEASRQ